ncbi:MAG: hypothetical protein R3C71_07005 [Candidatus Krumholzibacteriia bacterium]
MPPFHLPWSTFGALLTLAAAVLLALVWALADLSRERRGGGR